MHSTSFSTVTVSRYRGDTTGAAISMSRQVEMLQLVFNYLQLFAVHLLHHLTQRRPSLGHVIPITPQTPASFSPSHPHQLPAATKTFHHILQLPSKPFLHSIAPFLPTKTKMSSNKDGSNTYPSIDGSDVLRSSSFWSLPTLVSSPAWSCQSMVTNVSSQPDKMSYEILFDYPALSRRCRILEEFTKWFHEASIKPGSA